MLAKTIAVTDAAGPFVLDHLTFGATTASHVVLSGFDALGNLIASATLSVTASPDEYRRSRPSMRPGPHSQARRFPSW